MDPVSIIVTALSAGAAAGMKPTAEKAVKDSYEAVKSLITKRFGEKKDLRDAIQKLEDKPDSSARLELVREEVSESGVADDKEVFEMAKALLEELKTSPEHQQITQTVTGNENIFSGTGDVTVGPTPRSK